MASIDERMRLLLEWLHSSQKPDDEGGAGWGWIHEVPPNPQNTAEVVCALAAAGIPVPRAGEVRQLLRRATSVREDGELVFVGPVDVAWQLQALYHLGVSAEDPSVRACLRILVREQDAESGGYRMSGTVGPVSLAATATAMHALAPYVGDDEQLTRVALRGLSFLYEAMLADDVRARPVYAAALIGAVLVRPEYTGVIGKRSRRAIELAVERMLDGLASRENRTEEESFYRGESVHTWRHLSLHLAVASLLRVDGNLIFDPVVRAAFTELLELQVMSRQHVGRGGFRTSPEGFVTSFATAAALVALVAARDAIGQIVNPGKVFDMICRLDGVHHRDGREVLRVGEHTMVLNSGSGAAFFVLGLVSALTVTVGALPEWGTLGGRLLVICATTILAVGTLVWSISRFPAVSRGRIAAGVFGGFTAVFFPIITFLPGA
ncbi:prenyltransferase/squalene oxidase repeat-containing protein [Nocardia thailandica]